jgi:hypothetical protein
MPETRDAHANEVSVDSHILPDSGLRADHERLRETAMNCFRMGWGNEQTCRVTGLVASIVSKYRHEYDKERKDAK